MAKYLIDIPDNLMKRAMDNPWMATSGKWSPSKFIKRAIIVALRSAASAKWDELEIIEVVEK